MQFRCNIFKKTIFFDQLELKLGQNQENISKIYRKKTCFKLMTINVTMKIFSIYLLSHTINLNFNLSKKSIKSQLICIRL
jgi:hypothetical protein